MGMKPNPDRKMKDIICVRCGCHDSVPQYRCRNLCNSCANKEQRKAQKRNKEKKERKTKIIHGNPKRFFCNMCMKTFLSKTIEWCCPECKKEQQIKYPKSTYSHLNENIENCVFTRSNEGQQLIDESLTVLLEKMDESFCTKEYYEVSKLWD